jgi:hypothetical protein
MLAGVAERRERRSIPPSNCASGPSWAVGPRDDLERRSAKRRREANHDLQRGKCKLDPEGKCEKCGKRGACGVYWYKFMWDGKLVRESTRQGNDKIARNMESAHRTSLAKGEVGIREKQPSPILSEFLSRRFEPWAKTRFEKNALKTWLWYRDIHASHSEIQIARVLTFGQD